MLAKACVNKITCQANRVNLCLQRTVYVSNKGYTQRKSIAEVQEIKFRQSRQIKSNLYVKVYGLYLAKFIMFSFNYS